MRAAEESELAERFASRLWQGIAERLVPIARLLHSEARCELPVLVMQSAPVVVTDNERDPDVSDCDRRQLGEIEMVGRDRHEKTQRRAGVCGPVRAIKCIPTETRDR